MAVLKIRKKGDPILRGKSRPIEKISPRILTLLDDMKDTLDVAEGVGLAAPQVGVLRRVVIIDMEEVGHIELINPEIIYREGEQQESEGCLSVPGQWGITRRPAKVKVQALNRHGEMCEYEGEGLLARCFCHEIDHLNGKLYVDPDVLVEMLEPDDDGDDE